MKLLKYLAITALSSLLFGCETLDLSPDGIELSGAEQQAVIRASKNISSCFVLEDTSDRGLNRMTPLVFNEGDRSLHYEGEWFSVYLPNTHDPYDVQLRARSSRDIIVSVSENVSGKDRTLKLKADNYGKSDIATIIQHSK